MENITISNFSRTTAILFAVNIVGLVADILDLLICFSILCIIIYRFVQMKHNQRSLVIDIPIILSMNTLGINMLACILEIIHVDIPTLMKDLQLITEYQETPVCRFRAYILWSIIGVLYWSYVLLVFFRFIRIIYPNRLWFHRSSLYIYILIPSQFLFVFLTLLPIILIFDSIHQIPNEAYCSIVSIPLYPLLYTTFIIFSMPISIMCFCYTCVIRKMRQTTMIRHDQHRRDYVVIRRMIFSITILIIVVIPYIILYIKSAIEYHFDIIFYRIQWLSSSMGGCLFAITLPWITTQLRDLLRMNQLRPTNIN